MDFVFAQEAKASFLGGIRTTEAGPYAQRLTVLMVTPKYGG